MPEPSYAEWAAARDAPRFTDWLRERAEPAWSEMVNHRFTEELGAGTIAESVMARYLIQDYSFLDSFCMLLGFAVAHAPAFENRVPLAQFLAGVTGGENTYFQRAFETLGVAPQTYRDPELTEVTRGFHEAMRTAGASGAYPRILCALVAFEWSYLTWAERVKDGPAEHFLHREWIAMHAGEGFSGFVAWLRGELDREGPALAEADQQALAEQFRHIMSLEKAFFDQAYAA